MSTVTIAIIAGVVVLVVIVVLLVLWKRVRADEALVISGFGTVRPGPDSLYGFRVVTGGGAIVIPRLQSYDRISLAEHRADITVSCPTGDGRHVKLDGLVVFKVGDDHVSVANAARRFLRQPERIPVDARDILLGHVRAIVRNLTYDEVTTDRARLTELSRQSIGIEMEKLGLIIDSLQFQEIVEVPAPPPVTYTPPVVPPTAPAPKPPAGPEPSATQEGS